MFLLVIMGFRSQGQHYFFDCQVNFEENTCFGGVHLLVDTSSHNNAWNICIPHKQVFDSAYSTPNAIVTDSAGPYPVNDTSSFILQIVFNPGCGCSPVVGATYKMDCDSLSDYGKIEVSRDEGRNWLNILAFGEEGIWLTEKPVFTGQVHKWRDFLFLLPFYLQPDTILYRFTFISDSVQTNKEGWMLDNIKLLLHTEGAPAWGFQNEAAIYPNPARDYLYIDIPPENHMSSVSVYTLPGQLIMHKPLHDSKNYIDISGLGKGVYLVRIQGSDQPVNRKIIKE